MDNILTLGLTPEETVQMKTELDTMLAGLKRMRIEMNRAQQEFDASDARTDIMLKDLQTMLANRRRI